MYWDNYRVGRWVEKTAEKAAFRWEHARRSYINDLTIVDAIFVPGHRAFVGGKCDEEYTEDAVRAVNHLENAVWIANRTIDSYYEVDVEYQLSMIEGDTYFRVLGCTTDEGLLVIENALLDCREFGYTEILCSN